MTVSNLWSSDMRVLFVLKQIDYEPIGLMQLASVLQQGGHEVRAAAASNEDPVEAARNWQPHILAYSVWTGGQRYLMELNRRIRQHVDAFSAFGGPHATFFPEMLEEDDLIDGVCVGEGEGALLDLANTLQRGQPPYNLPNWHFRVRNGANGSGEHEIVRNLVRPAIENLDALPMPDRALFYDYDPLLRSSPLKHFITGRGCPYDCSYCFNHAWAEIYQGNGRRLRRRSVDLVLDEIDEVRQRWGLGFVIFLDDTFTIQKPWLAEFAEKYPQRIGLPFFCNVRANLVTAALAQQLAQAGCYSVGMGIETADDQLRNEILKRNMSRQQIVQACKTLRDAGIGVLTTNMIGLPGGSLEMDLETVRLNAECRPAFANAFLFQPYPRTELGEYAARLGVLEGDINDIDMSAWNRSILNFPPAEKRQIENLQKLFAITVEFPWLMPLTRQLIKLPNNPLFWFVHKLWKGYTIQRRLHPVGYTWREYLSMVRKFIKLE
jgi:anaerobic magnesium-protoporphyrin IX monomethyl ester cyclase